MALSIPREMKIRLVQSTAVEDLDLLNVGVAVSLALMIAFATGYFVSPGRPKHLILEALGWAAVLVFFVWWLVRKRKALSSETYEIPLDFTVSSFAPTGRRAGRPTRR